MTIGTQTDVRLPVVFQPDRPAVHFLKTAEWRLPPHDGIPNISEFSGSSVEPDDSTSSLTTVACITSLFTAPPIERRPQPFSLRKYLSPNLTTSGPSAADPTTSGPSAANVTAFGPSAACDIASGPSAAHLTTPGPRAVHSTSPGPSAVSGSNATNVVFGFSAVQVTASGPSAVHLTTSGPRAAQPTSLGPSADLTTTSSDLDDRARFPPSSSTSHYRRTPTSPTPSDSEINPSAFLAQLYPSASSRDHDTAQSDEVDLSLVPNVVAEDSRPPFGTVNGQPPGKRNPKLTRVERDKWKIEEARRRGEQMSEADKRAIHNAIQNGMAAYYGRPYKVRSSLLLKKK